MKKTIHTMLGAAIVLMAVPAVAQVHITQDGRPERIFRPVSGLNPTDSDFLKKAAIINLFEIKISEMAAGRSNDPFVKEFAKEMILDHTVAWNQLKEVATGKGIELPMELPPQLEKRLMHLENQSGVNFDNAFENTQMGGHAQASMLYKNEIEKGKDEDVKGYAVLTLPTITMHYKMTLTKQTEMGDMKMQTNQ